MNKNNKVNEQLADEKVRPRDLLNRFWRAASLFWSRDIENDGMAIVRRIAAGDRAAGGCGLRNEPLEQGDL